MGSVVPMVSWMSVYHNLLVNERAIYTMRYPVVAGRFYPGTKGECQDQIGTLIGDHYELDVPLERIVAGIVPHAGWAFSGRIAASVFAAIGNRQRPETFVLISAAHGMVFDAFLSSVGAWETPMGDVTIDQDLATAILESAKGYVTDSQTAHDMEHSAEVQVPIIQYLFPEAKIVPIIVPSMEKAPEIGALVGEAVRSYDKDVVILGTTDLTHYGTSYSFTPKGIGEEAHRWVKEENDKRMVDMCLKMEAEKIVPEAEANHSACGPGAVAATVAAARTLGVKEGHLIKYATSHDIMPRGEPSDFVGYAGIVY